MLDSYDYLIRILSITILLFSITYSYIYCRNSYLNIIFWSNLGLLFLYASYLISNIRFSNGFSVNAEIFTSILCFLSGIFFHLGFKNNRKILIGTAGVTIKGMGYTYILILISNSIIFYLFLTDGQIWRVVTDGVGLKYQRLLEISEKSPILLNLDALALSTTIIGFVWSILSYKNIGKNINIVYFYVLLATIYVMSTGSRSPILMFILLAISAIAIGKNYSTSILTIYNYRYKFGIVIFLIMLFFMVITTALRVESENLNSIVFEEYFKINDFGLIKSMVESSNSAIFFLSTVITYSASTYNNIVIRFQEINYITPSYGYRFFFYLISAFKIFTPESIISNIFNQWKDLATENNIFLLDISAAAGQWATPYGDLIWDFGLTGAVIITIISAYFMGVIIKNTHKYPSLQNLLLSTIIIGTCLLPLTHPLLSLYFQYLLFICLCFRFKIFSKLFVSKK